MDIPAQVADVVGVAVVLQLDQVIRYKAGQGFAITDEMAQEISGNAPLSLKGMKTIFNSLLRYQTISPEDLNAAQMLVAQTLGSEDLKEGRKAFAEKRKPVFRGK